MAGKASVVSSALHCVLCLGLFLLHLFTPTLHFVSWPSSAVRSSFPHFFFLNPFELLCLPLLFYHAGPPRSAFLRNVWFQGHATLTGTEDTFGNRPAELIETILTDFANVRFPWALAISAAQASHVSIWYKF